MSSSVPWTVFDLPLSFTPTSPTPPDPETLIAEIDASIAALEHSRAALLETPDDDDELALADEFYKAACAQLAAGKPDAAVRSLRVALATCSLGRNSKVRSLLAYASQQLRFRDQHCDPSGA